jgi:hypothetical protein
MKLSAENQALAMKVLGLPIEGSAMITMGPDSLDRLLDAARAERRVVREPPSPGWVRVSINAELTEQFMGDEAALSAWLVSKAWESARA